MLLPFSTRLHSHFESGNFNQVLKPSSPLTFSSQHFPLTETYVPLFPRGKSGPFSLSWANLKGKYRVKSNGQEDQSEEDQDDEDEDEENGDENQEDLPPTDPESKELAIKIHNLVKEKMKNGEMDKEPELSLKEENWKGKKVVQEKKVDDDDDDVEDESQSEDEEEKEEVQSKSKSKSSSKEKKKSKDKSSKQEAESDALVKEEKKKDKSEKKKSSKSEEDSKKKKKRKRIDLGLEDGSEKKKKSKKESNGRKQVEEEGGEVGLEGDDFFE